MLENFINIGAAAIGVSGSAASIYSAISAVATGRFQDRLLSLLAPDRLTRIGEHILYAHDSLPVTSTSAVEKLIDPRRVLDGLQKVQRVVKQDIVTSGVLPTPEQLQREFNLSPSACLIGIEPLHRVTSARGGDWAAILFQKDGIPHVGWQKAGILRALIGIEYRDDLEAWLKRMPAPPTAAVTQGARQPGHRVDTRPNAAAAAPQRHPVKMGRPAKEKAKSPQRPDETGRKPPHR